MTQLEKLTCSVQEACDLLSIGMTTFYELVNAGRVQTVKLGTRRLVVVQSLRDLLNSLSTNESANQTPTQAMVSERRRRKDRANAH